MNRATRIQSPNPLDDPFQFIVPGALVKHFTHDALGRLVRVQSPFPEPAPGETGLLRTERLFYDGVRRIQEVIIDPAMSLDMALAGEGGAALQGEAQLIASNAAEELDGAATPAMLESAQLGEGDGGGASQMNGTPITPGTTMSLAREYVWGPGDWGVDELLVQYDAARRATWPILDSGGDVIALCDLGGTNNSARVLTRIVYDAYGRVIGRSDPATPATGPPELRVGHKGLFFDRLDWGIVDPLTLEETPRLEPGATLLGYNRNRTLHVGWGRFLQRDPNATGLPVQAGLGFHGDGFAASVQGFDLAVHYGDGANVYEYIGSDPLGGSDPTGLFFSIADVFGAATTSAGLQQNWTEQVAETGVSAGMSIANMLGGYAFEQLLDLNWASNWSEADDLYRGSAAWSSGTGSWEGSANGGSLGTPGLQIAGWWEDIVENKSVEYDSKNAKGLGVYVLRDSHDNVLYVGRSSDVKRRAAESARRLGLKLADAIVIPLDSTDAVRALEDLGIRANKLIDKGHNKINGMSRRDMKSVKDRYKALKAILRGLTK